MRWAYTSVYFRMVATICSDWEIGANRIALRQHKWLLQEDLYRQVYVLVVTCICEERYN